MQARLNRGDTKNRVYSEWSISNTTGAEAFACVEFRAFVSKILALGGDWYVIDREDTITSQEYGIRPIHQISIETPVTPWQGCGWRLAGPAENTQKLTAERPPE